MKANDYYQFQGQLTIFDILDQDIWSGKMSQEHSVQELPREQTSEQSLKKSLKLLSRKSPIFLSLKRDGPTQGALKEWVMMESPSALLGDSTMLNTGESPNEERESHLSQILEVNPPPKYSFSARACQGILNRANRRGKQLPEMLEKALIRQSAFRNEQDVQGEVKEFLSNTTEQEHCQPSTTNPSSDDVYCIQGNCIDRSDTAGCNGKGWRTNESFTLNTVDHHAICQPSCNKEPILLESNQNHATIQTNGISTSLPAAMGEGGGYVPMVVDEPKPCAYDGSQIAPTLTANNANGSQRMPDKGNFNAVIGFDSYNLAETGDKGRCLATNSGGLNEHMPIVCGVDAFNQTETKDKTMPLTSAATDNHHIPCVYSVDEGAGKSSACHYEDVSPTLATTHHGEPAVCYGLDRASFNQGKNAKYDFSVEEDKAQPIVARGPGGGNDGIIGSLCARDSKGVGNQYVEEGKCIIQFYPGQSTEDK